NCRLNSRATELTPPFFGKHSEHVERLCNIFNPMCAHALKIKLTNALNLFNDCTRDDYIAGFGERLEADRDVDAVTKYVIPIQHNVADMQADSETLLFFRWDSPIPPRHSTLKTTGAPNGIDGTVELYQYPIAERLNEASSVSPNRGSKVFSQVPLKSGMRANLIAAHQAAVARDVSDQYSCKLS